MPQFVEQLVMIHELGEPDAKEIELEVKRLDRLDEQYMNLPFEIWCDDDLEEIWGWLDSEVFLVSPAYSTVYSEVRRWDEFLWLARRGDKYWIVDYEDIPTVVPEGLVSKEESETIQSLWRSLNTDVFAVVRNIGGLREGPDPELVRYFQGDSWLGVWHGVYEVWPAAQIDNVELIPATEWANHRPETRYTQVQNRIGVRLRERGLDFVTPEIDGIQSDSETGVTWDDFLNYLRSQRVTWCELWSSLRSEVFVWVRSCQIRDLERQVRRWRGDLWLWRDSEGRHGTIRTSKLRDWGCLVRWGDWERVYPESVAQWISVDAVVSPRELGRRRRFDHFGSKELDWRKSGF